jgi:glycosyltransferase involved in cell wall biosynthesis
MVESDDVAFTETHGRKRTPELAIRLTIVMPAYNEGATVTRAIHHVLDVDYPCPVELIVVDDGSTDSTAEQLRAIDDDRVVVLTHPRNLGKGAALRTAIQAATGTHLVPFDADMEYSATDLPPLLAPIIAGRCRVVYGTRLFGVNTVYHSLHYAVGNRVMTLATNVLFGSYISDLHTCLKLVPLEILRAMDLRESGFGLDTEITANALKMGIRPFEVPVSYFARSHHEGKKINWRDGVQCFRVLGRVRLSRKVQLPPALPLGHGAGSLVSLARPPAVLGDEAASAGPALDLPAHRDGVIESAGGDAALIEVAE